MGHTESYWDLGKRVVALHEIGTDGHLSAPNSLITHGLGSCTQHSTFSNIFPTNFFLLLISRDFPTQSMPPWQTELHRVLSTCHAPSEVHQLSSPRHLEFSPVCRSTKHRVSCGSFTRHPLYDIHVCVLLYVNIYLLTHTCVSGSSWQSRYNTNTEPK